MASPDITDHPSLTLGSSAVPSAHWMEDGRGKETSAGQARKIHRTFNPESRPFQPNGNVKETPRLLQSSCDFIFNKRSSPFNPAKDRQQLKSPNTCDWWNMGDCERFDCRFQHICSTCKVISHSLIHCPYAGLERKCQQRSERQTKTILSENHVPPYKGAASKCTPNKPIILKERPMYKCASYLCKQQYTTLKELVIHQETSHKYSAFCPKLDCPNRTDFLTYDKLYKHMGSMHLNTDLYWCHLCNKSAPVYAKGAEKHVRYAHPEANPDKATGLILENLRARGGCAP